MFDEFDPGRALLQGYIARHTAARLSRMLGVEEKATQEGAAQATEALPEDTDLALRTAEQTQAPPA